MEFDHFIVHLKTMQSIHDFIVSDGDLHETKDPNDDGLCDLWDFPTKPIQGTVIYPHHLCRPIIRIGQVIGDGYGNAVLPCRCTKLRRQRDGRYHVGIVKWQGNIQF